MYDIPTPLLKVTKKYNLLISFDFEGRNGRKYYKLWTKDGCSWENGLSYRGVFKECKLYKALCEKHNK